MTLKVTNNYYGQLYILSTAGLFVSNIESNQLLKRSSSQLHHAYGVLATMLKTILSSLPRTVIITALCRFGSVWLQFSVACCSWGFIHQISRSFGVKNPHLTQCVVGPQKRTRQMTCKSIELFERSVRVWQTTLFTQCRRQINRKITYKKSVVGIVDKITWSGSDCS